MCVFLKAKVWDCEKSNRRSRDMFLTFNLSTVILTLGHVWDTAKDAAQDEIPCTKVKHFQLVHVYKESQWKKSSEIQKCETQGSKKKVSMCVF